MLELARCVLGTLTPLSNQIGIDAMAQGYAGSRNAWLQAFLNDLGFNGKRPGKSHCDGLAATLLGVRSLPRPHHSLNSNMRMTFQWLPFIQEDKPLFQIEA